MSDGFDFLGLGSLLGGITNLGSTIYNAINGKKERKEDQIRQDTALQRNAADAAAIGINPLTASGFGGSDATVSSTGNIDTTNLTSSLNNFDSLAVQNRQQNLAKEQLEFNRESHLDQIAIERDKLVAQMKQYDDSARRDEEYLRLAARKQYYDELLAEREEKERQRLANVQTAQSINDSMNKIYDDLSKSVSSVTSGQTTDTKKIQGEVTSSLEASIGVLKKLTNIGAKGSGSSKIAGDLSFSETEMQQITNNYIEYPEMIAESKESLSTIVADLNSGLWNYKSMKKTPFGINVTLNSSDGKDTKTLYVLRTRKPSTKIIE